MTPAQLDQLSIALHPIGQATIAFALFMIMLGVALGLRIKDFDLVRQAPRLFFGGVASQVIGLPLVTLALIVVLSPPPSVALGMIVVAACPGGNVSNMLTFFAKGDVAFSVSLTAASSAFATYLTPAAILFWSSLYPPTANLLADIEIDKVGFLLQTTALLALPLTIGMLIGARFPGFADAVRRHVALFGGLALGGVVIYGALQIWREVAGALVYILPIAALHNAVAFLTGVAAGRALAAPRRTRRALVFEVGVQNTGLALVILLSQLQGLGGAAAMAAVWSIWHLISGGAIVALYRRLDARASG